MALDNQQITHPDSPFRIGVTGKYKLLIKSVVPCSDGYEYFLIDADGKKYKGVSPKHFAPDQLLRCVVCFKVVNASLLVSETRICGKQDLASFLPEEPEQKREIKNEEKPMASIARGMLGDPIKSRKSGIYKLLIVKVAKGERRSSYVLEDAIGRKYKAQNKKLYKEGKVIGCRINILVTKSGLKAEVVSMGKSPKPLKNHNSHSRRESRDWLPAPINGTHFHLIYTPVGNKR